MSGEPLLADEGGVNWRTAFSLPTALRRPADRVSPAARCPGCGRAGGRAGGEPNYGTKFRYFT
jgi:hypothetical protein